jgi:hypothetical protein
MYEVWKWTFFQDIVSHENILTLRFSTYIRSRVQFLEITLKYSSVRECGLKINMDMDNWTWTWWHILKLFLQVHMYCWYYTRVWILAWQHIFSKILHKQKFFNVYVLKKKNCRARTSPSHIRSPSPSRVP